MTDHLSCVVDASVGIKKFIIDPLTPKVDELFARFTDPNAYIYIPDLFYIECTNIAWKYIRAGFYSVSEAQTNLTSFRALNFRSISTADLMLDALVISATHTISAYDACYVALSQRVNAPLLTQDQKLVNALSSTAFDVRLFSDFSVPSLPSSE
ncbi:type II toxin-antitoxin system VapC family toxin [Leptolyngbya sp. AN03gr2]|uniref:type II toxin-antitoxin system VapC family toxin n=1 Tax=unclassified Leptolyngbya TaxID=2650499 RepID=UPI003D31308C